MGTSNGASKNSGAKPVNLEKALPFLLVVGSLLLGLFLIEFPAMVRWVDYRGIVGPQREYFTTTKGDPELLFVRRPNAHISGTAWGGNIADIATLPAADIRQYRWDVTYDRNGFRNPSGLAKADIALLGDSFLESPSIASHQLVTSVLARLEGKVVANFGQIGYGPGQESVVLQRFALPLHPSTVVWMFYEGNDLGDMLNYDAAMHAAHEPPHFSDPFRSLLARSFTNNILLQLRRFAPKPPGKRQSGIVATNGNSTTTYFLYSGHRLSAGELHALDLTREVFKEGQQACATHGCRLVIAFIPQKFRVFQPFCRFPPESTCRSWVVNDLPERLRDIVRSISSDMEFLDLTPYLQNGLKQGIFPYYPDDSHWSEEGHRIAAEAIDKYLRSTQSP